MKILVVTQYFYPENFRINDLVDGFLEEGHSVDVLTGFPNYPKGVFFEGYSIFSGPFREKYNSANVYRVPLVSRGKKKGIQLLMNYISFVISAILFSIIYLLPKKYDHIFVYEVSPITVALPAIFIKFFKKIKITMWVTDLWPESLVATGVIRNKNVLSIVGSVVRYIYKHTDNILISSRAFSKSISIYTNKTPIYLPQWAEMCFLEKNNSSTFKSDLPEGFKILFAGNVGTSQGIDTIIEAARKLIHIKEIQWVIIGDGLGKKEAIDLVNNSEMKNNFHFLDAKPLVEMPEYYNAVDALIILLKNTPLFEITVPGKVQACLASGKPIIASINGEASRIIKEAGGFVSPAGDPIELAKNVLLLYEMTREMRENVGKNGFSYYQKNFDRNNSIKKILDIMIKN